MKKFIVVLLAILMLFALFEGAMKENIVRAGKTYETESPVEKEASQTIITLHVGQTSFTANGVSDTLDSPPVIKNGRTLVPIRAIIEALGGTIGWDAAEKKVTVSFGSTIIELWISKSTAKVNGISTSIDPTNSQVVPEIIDGRTMLPLRFVAESLDCSVDWNATTKTITIRYPESMYFPSNTSSIWETKSLAGLGWNQNAVQPLRDFLTQKNTKSFMILVNGRIVMEEYFNGHSSTSTWEWNSAGKTLVSATTGIAQQEGLLNIDNKVSDYLGTGWTSMPLSKEDLITVRHLLSMTAGNDDTKEYVTKRNLTCVADAGTRWAYSNIFQKLIDVVANASNESFDNYFNEKLKSEIGMDGYWKFGTIFTIYHSTARGMARFGLLALNNGKWNSKQIIDEAFFRQSISTSQDINPSYGYLWWLNGKSSYMIPGKQTIYQGYLVPNAPADMYAAMGANDQRIYVIPSKKMVVIRMGDASDPANPNFAVSGFDNELWSKIDAVMN